MRGVFAADPERVAIVESALIFEVEKWGTAPGWVERFDRLILVTVPDEVKIVRFVSRIMAKEGSEGGESRLTALRRMPARGWRRKFPIRKRLLAATTSSTIQARSNETRTVVATIYRELLQAGAAATATTEMI